MLSSVPLALLHIGRFSVSCFHLLLCFVLKSDAKVITIFQTCKQNRK